MRPLPSARSRRLSTGGSADVLTVKIIALELGMLLMYAGIKGLSVRRLLVGDSTSAAQNQSVTQ